MNEPIPRHYIAGEQVTAKVEKIYPYGIFVHLADGARAYIRRRELSLTGDLDPRAGVQIGQEISAIVYNLPRSGRIMELSHKATLPDPWTTFTRKFYEGAVIEGCVKDIRAVGVFVEIMPGIKGMIAMTEVAGWHAAKPKELFWIGDHVEAIITRIDPYQRKVNLSLWQRREQLTWVADVLERLDQPAWVDPAAAQAATQLAMALGQQTEPAVAATVGAPEQARVGRILVIEDSREICEPLVTWLAHRGYSAVAAHTPAQARQWLGEATYGLILLDIDLQEMNGLTLLQQMRSMCAGARIAVMSVAEQLEEHAKTIEELGVVETFVKPLDLDEIDHFLAKLGRNEFLPAWRALPITPATPASASFPEFMAATESGGSVVEQLQADLQQLVRQVGAEVGMIFHKDANSQVISVLTQVGPLLLAPNAIYAFKESPVKDVLYEQSVIFELRVSTQAEGRFRKLLDLFPFESCIGIPIGRENVAQYALFLFHHQTYAFRRFHVRDALATATLCAAHIEQASFQQRLRSLNKLLLNGQLAASFTHEVFNKLSGLEIQLYNLQNDCGSVVQQLPAFLSNPNFSLMKRDLDTLVEGAKDLRGMVENFQRLMRADDEGRLDVGRTVRNVIAQVRPFAHKAGVKLKIECPAELPPVVGSTLRLQQVLLNLLLNAIQQMAESTVGRKSLEISVTQVNADRTWPIKIRILDDGPGIHRQLWEKIFELGFTTRNGGSGLGLYIARSLVESFSGKLTIERSVVPLGTTFLLELPTFVSPTKEAGQ